MYPLRTDNPLEKIGHELRPFFEDNTAKYNATEYKEIYGSSVQAVRRILLPYVQQGILKKQRGKTRRHYVEHYSPVINDRFMKEHLRFWEHQLLDDPQINNLLSEHKKPIVVLDGDITSGTFNTEQTIAMTLLDTVGLGEKKNIFLQDSKVHVEVSSQPHKQFNFIRPYVLYQHK